MAHITGELTPLIQRLIVPPPSVHDFAYSGLLLGRFIDSFANMFLIGTYETLISLDLHVRQTTGMNPNIIILAGAVLDAAFKPLIGTYADAYGVRRVISATSMILASGYCLTSLSWDAWSLLIWRSVTGLGDTGFDLLPTLLIDDTVSRRQFGLWRFVLVAVDAGGAAVGGAVSSYVLTKTGTEAGGKSSRIAAFLPSRGLLLQLWWRLPLLLTSVVMILVCGMLWPRFSDDKPRTIERGGHGEDDRTTVKLKLFSGLLIALSVVCGLLTLNLAGSRDRSGDVFSHSDAKTAWIISFSVVTIVSILILVLVEKYVVTQSSLPWGSALELANVCLSFSKATAVLASSLILKMVAFRTEVQDWALFSLALGTLLGSLMGGSVIHQGRHIRSYFAGAVILSFALYLSLAFGRIDPGGQYSIPTMLLFGGTINFVDQLVVWSFLGQIEAEEKKTLYAFFSLVTNITRDTGVTLAAVLLDANTAIKLTRIFPDTSNRNLLVREAMNSLGYVQSLEEPLRGRVLECLAEGKRKGFGIAAAVVLLALAALPYLTDAASAGEDYGDSHQEREETSEEHD